MSWELAEKAVFNTIKTRTGGEAYLDQPLADTEDGPFYDYWCMNSGLGGGDTDLYEVGCHSSHDLPTEIIGVYTSREACQKLFKDITDVLTAEGSFETHADVNSFILTSTPVIVRDDSDFGAVYTITLQGALRFN